jgi:hypothetical protein
MLQNPYQCCQSVESGYRGVEGSEKLMSWVLINLGAGTFLFLSLVESGDFVGTHHCKSPFESGPLCKGEAWPLVRRRQLVPQTRNN